MRLRSFLHRVAAVGATTLGLSVLGSSGLGWAATQAAEPPVKIILDTDMGFDCDDAAAVALLHTLADNGEAEILAMGVCSGGENQKWGPPCLDAVNTYHGRPDIPIGLGRRNGRDDASKFSRQVAEEFPNDLPGEKAPDVVAVYRKALADAPDASVTFTTIGYLTNVPELLASPGDETSPLTGKELVAKKVKHWVCMAGGYPKGREWNFYADPEASLAALRDWPTPIVFCGFEIGNAVRTGAGYAEAPKANPSRRAYELHVGAGKAHGSWDQTAVLYAVRANRDAIWKLSESG
ncbi:MAG TPA: nucleoside hydrolase, partial [Pirellulales bacterium]